MEVWECDSKDSPDYNFSTSASALTTLFPLPTISNKVLVWGLAARSYMHCTKRTGRPPRGACGKDFEVGEIGGDLHGCTNRWNQSGVNRPGTRILQGYLPKRWDESIEDARCFS